MVAYYVVECIVSNSTYRDPIDDNVCYLISSVRRDDELFGIAVINLDLSLRFYSTSGACRPILSCRYLL